MEDGYNFQSEELKNLLQEFELRINADLLNEARGLIPDIVREVGNLPNGEDGEDEKIELEVWVTLQRQVLFLGTSKRTVLKELVEAINADDECGITIIMHE